MKHSYILIILFFSCKKIDVSEIRNLNDNNKILVLGHGGSGFQSGHNPWPSNSEPSISKAIDGLNADGTEVDVQLSADNELILFHDGILDAYTNCTGCIYDKSAEELSKCKYKQDVSQNAKDLRIITLRSIFEKYADYTPKPYIYLDVKVTGSCITNSPDLVEKYVQALIKLDDEFQFADRVVIESTHLDLLIRIKEQRPDLTLMIDNGNFEYSLKACMDYGLQGIVLDNGISKEEVEEAHLNNIKIIIFGVKYRKVILEAVEKHPDGIQTDNIIVLQEILTR